jgi:hypothetical protein
MAVVSGGTTLIDNGALDPAVPSGKLVLLSTQTASASATIDFTSGIDSTYDSYVFKFINCHPQNNSVSFQFNMSSDGGSNYNVTKTTTYFKTYHDEGDTASGLIYESSYDLAQSTSFQQLTENTGNGNDECFVGTMSLFNPSSTTFVKHFLFKSSEYQHQNYNLSTYVAGYGNTTSSVDAIQFKFSSGNIDSGTIKMYGVG